VPDGLGKNGQIGVSFAYGTVENTGFNNTWSWRNEPAANCPDTFLGEKVFGKSCADNVVISIHS
jgi:hypothetical protein